MEIVKIIVVVLIGIFILAIPGEIATRRGHPNKTPIKVAGYLGALTFSATWFVAIIWSLCGTYDPPRKRNRKVQSSSYRG